ncbi:hypothetical protein evm_014429 [Chilo suppressalis]|nr:hypothetical protein evm_014429 [Chilo suppressalis]
MVQKCVVLGCGSKWYPGCSLVFHSFPKEPTRRSQWLSSLKLKNKFYETAKVCSNHFVATDYILENRLKHTAIPFYSDVLEQSEVKNEASSVSVYYTPVKHDTIFPSTPSTSHCGLSDSLAMPEESLPTSNAMLTPIDLEKLVEVDNFTENIPLNAAGQDNISPPKKKTCRRDVLEEIIVENEVDDENTAPMKSFYSEKSVQVKLKTKREEILQKRNKSLMQKFVRHKKKVDNMQSLLATIREYTNNSEIENIIKGNFSNICEIFKKPPTDPRGVRYSDEVKAFALTLHFYSPKAYEFLKKLVALPHIETLRRSLATFNCNVGFLTEVLDYLKQEVMKSDKIYLKNVALIFDGMSVKKDLSPDQKTGKIFGYVDLGEITVSDPEQLASEALVFQIVSYGHYFKCPIAYFFIPNCLSGDLLAELLHTAIILLHEIDITVRSLTCDGAASNIKAYECLGCSLEEDNWKPYFLHPNSVTNVYCILDAAHILKLARNTLAEFVITSKTGNISFEYIKKLHEIQMKEGLKFANKLSANHVDFKNKK